MIIIVIYTGIFIAWSKCGNRSEAGNNDTSSTVGVIIVTLVAWLLHIVTKLFAHITIVTVDNQHVGPINNRRSNNRGSNNCLDWHKLDMVY